MKEIRFAVLSCSYVLYSFDIASHSARRDNKRPKWFFGRRGFTDHKISPTTGPQLSKLTALAGALGKPVWIMLPFCPDFRWLRDRSDSPWYPTAKLFRQTKDGVWADVFEQVASEPSANHLAIFAAYQRTRII
jgi:hypothetical protein